MSHIVFKQLAADGAWFYIRPNQPHGVGPFPSQAAAEEAASACPVSLPDLYGALLRGEFRPFDSNEAMEFQGIEYDGYIWEMDSEVRVVCDHGPGGPHFQVIRTDDNGDTDTWFWEPAGQFAKIL